MKMKLNIQRFAVTKTTSFEESNVSIEDNTSTLKITIYFSANNDKTYFSSETLYCTCNGVEKSAKVAHPKGGSTTKTFTFDNIAHGADGTKSVSWSWNCNTRTSVLGNVSASGTKTLQTIPRASEVDANNGNLEEPVAITITRKADTFLHTLRYVCGETSGWINDIDNKVATSSTWTPPLSLASESPTSDTVACTIFCQTYTSSGTAVGTEEFTIIDLAIPNLPPINVNINSITDTNSYKNTYGTFIQNKSAISAILSGTPQYTTIKNYAWEIRQTNSSGELLASGNSSNISYIPTTSGTLYISGIVTDNRNKSTSTNTTVTVASYSSPKCSLVLSRTDSTTANYTVTGSGIVIDNLNYTKNEVTYILKRDSTIVASWNGSSLNQSGTDTILDQSYVYTLTAQDVISGITDTKTITISTTFTLLNFNSTGKAMAIGKASEATGNTKLLEIALPTEFKDTIKFGSNGYSTNNSAGYDTDQYGNFHHSANEAIGNLQFKDYAGNVKAKYYWETGDLETDGDISATDINANGDLNVNGDTTVSGNINTTGDIECSDLTVNLINILNELFYKPNDTITLGGTNSAELYVVNGYVTNAGRTLFFTLNLPKKLTSITTITPTSIKVEARGTSGYLNSISGFNEYVGASGYTVEAHKLNNNDMMFRIDKSTAFSNLNNNTPVVLVGYFEFELS